MYGQISPLHEQGRLYLGWDRDWDHVSRQGPGARISLPDLNLIPSNSPSANEKSGKLRLKPLPPPPSPTFLARSPFIASIHLH